MSVCLPKNSNIGSHCVIALVALVSLLTVAHYSQAQQQPRSSARLREQLNTSPLKPPQTPPATQPGQRGNNLRERSVVSSSSSSNSSSLSGRLESFVEDELPPDFYEMPPEQLDLGMNATGRAPVPILNVAVLQNNQVIDSAITVHPGTPLEMVIYLDDKSAKVYGLLASYLKVQDDTFRQREEVIILNGCSIDTYIFGNFEHNAEDQSLRAKFRAFKFPDSNFVRFIGTVNVCIKQCARVNCNGGGTANGGGSRRRKRGASDNNNNIAANNDRLVQLTVSTVLKIGNGQQPKGSHN